MEASDRPTPGDALDQAPEFGATSVNDPAVEASGSPEDVAALKARIAELESAGVAPGDPASDPNKPPVDPAAEADTTEVTDLRTQLEEQRTKIAELTGQTLAQKDPATADPNLDVRDLLRQLVGAQAEYRHEIASLRMELGKVRRSPLPATTARVLSPEELLAERLAEVDRHSHYCPACGALYNRARECTGKAASPHPAVEVVPTDELKDPPDASDKEAVAEYQRGHTGMTYVEPELNTLLALEV